MSDVWVILVYLHFWVKYHVQRFQTGIAEHKIQGFHPHLTGSVGSHELSDGVLAASLEIWHEIWQIKHEIGHILASQNARCFYPTRQGKLRMQQRRAETQWRRVD